MEIFIGVTCVLLFICLTLIWWEIREIHQKIDKKWKHR